MNKLKVVLVDDNKRFIEAVKAIISHRDDLEVIGEANDGEEFLELLQHISPEIVLMDINMPRINGIEAIKRSIIQDSSIKFIAVTMLDSMDAHLEMLNAGFCGGILKNMFTVQLEEALLSVKKGETYFPLLN